jgi:hypothetical protein
MSKAEIVVKVKDPAPDAPLVPVSDLQARVDKAVYDATHGKDGKPKPITPGMIVG